MASLTMCSDHWGQLRKAVDLIGLGPLVPENGGQARSRLQDMTTNGPTVDNFDPLMYCYMAIMQACMAMFGPALLADGNPNLCPLCWANSSYERFLKDDPTLFTGIIEATASDALKIWKGFKL